MSSAAQYDWESLLGRKAAPLEDRPLREAIGGKRILVTGAGGSIGSVLAREAAQKGAVQVVLLDASEQRLYRVDNELGAPHVSVLVDVRDRAGLDETFERYRPQVVFHGAAFKHVPLMEQNPFAAIENNSLGTLRLVQAAVEYGAEQLILVSTDKAVDPINIMGASKRIAELVLLSAPARSTRMAAVRLGNVLGSEGSVVPLFLEQAAAGEALTVTHPDASRYFTTLEEAVGLLLMASSRRLPGGILVPDLGAPIRIAELAGMLASKSKGPATPNDSAANAPHIVFTCLRPGDKLTEALISSQESINDSISDPATPKSASPLRPVSSPCPAWDVVKRALEELEASIARRDLGRMLGGVCGLVPEYRPGPAFRAALKSVELPAAVES